MGIDWAAAAAPVPALPLTAALSESAQSVGVETTKKLPADQNKELASTVTLKSAGELMVQRLPWDFCTTFPPAMNDAIEANVVDEDDALPENLAALHEDHAQALLTTMIELDALHEARRQGVDPATGKSPRTEGEETEAVE